MVYADLRKLEDASTQEVCVPISLRCMPKRNCLISNSSSSPSCIEERDSYEPASISIRITSGFAPNNEKIIPA